jgi:hypothetical protein
LYMKFSHPLSHGRKQGIEPIPNDVIISQNINNNVNQNETTKNNSGNQQHDNTTNNNSNNPYAKVEEEGVPVSRTELLAGGLWTVTCVDNPRSLHQVCSWAALMRHSLDEHRWHICREIIFVDSIVARDVRTRTLASLRRGALDAHIPRRHADLWSLHHLSSSSFASSSNSKSKSKGNQNNNANVLSHLMLMNSADGGADSLFFDRCKDTFLGVIDSLRNQNADEYVSQIQQELQFQEQLKLLTQNYSNIASNSFGSGANKNILPQQQQPLSLVVQKGKQNNNNTTSAPQNQIQDTNPLNSFRATDDFELPAMYNSKKNTLESVESNAIYGDQPPSDLKLHQQNQKKNQNQNNNNNNVPLLRPKNNLVFSNFDMLFANSQVRLDVLSQLQSSLASLHDLFLRRSTTEWDSGAIKGLKQTTLIDIMIESEIIIISSNNNSNNNNAILRSRSEFQDLILAEKQYREHLKKPPPQFTTTSTRQTTQPQAKSAFMAPTNNNFLSVASEKPTNGMFLSVQPQKTNHNNNNNNMSGATSLVKKESGFGMFLGIPRTTSDLDEYDTNNNNNIQQIETIEATTVATSTTLNQQQQQQQLSANNNLHSVGGDGEDLRRNMMMRFGNHNDASSSSSISMRGDYAKFISFEEFIGIIARLIQVEIINNKTNSFLPSSSKNNNNNQNSINNNSNNDFEKTLDPVEAALASLSSYKSATIQRLTNMSDATETSRFKDNLESLAVAERFATSNHQLQEVFESCATTHDGTPYSAAKERYDALHANYLAKLQQAQIQEDNKGNLLLLGASNANKSPNSSPSLLRGSSHAPVPPVPFITLETFNKLVQESAVLAVSPELTKHVFNEAMRLTNFKKHAARSNNSTMPSGKNESSFNGKGKGMMSSSFSSTTSASASSSANNNINNNINMLNMKFGGFLKAIALLAHAHDPLPSVPFEERLSKFIPTFCDSVRPIVLAMMRAKNVEIEKNVNVKAGEHRVLISGGGGGDNAVASSAAAGGRISPARNQNNKDQKHLDGTTTQNHLETKSSGVDKNHKKSSTPPKQQNQQQISSKSASENTAGSKGLRNFLSGRK